MGSQRENKDDLFPGLGIELWGKENSFRFGDPSQRKRSPTTVSLVSPKTGTEFLGTAWGLYCMKRNPVMVRVEARGAGDGALGISSFFCGVWAKELVRRGFESQLSHFLALWLWENDCLSEPQLIFKTGNLISTS